MNVSHQSVAIRNRWECPFKPSLGESLKDFFVLDTLTGIECNKCTTRTIKTRQFIFLHKPEVLIIQLKRYTNSVKNGRQCLEKVEGHTSFPFKLYLNSTPDCTYNLSSVVVHTGRSLESGHYWAYVRVGELWWEMNDESVTKVHFNTVSQAEAFIIIYQKSDDNSTTMNNKKKNCESSASSNDVTSDIVPPDESIVIADVPPILSTSRSPPPSSPSISVLDPTPSCNQEVRYPNRLIIDLYYLKHFHIHEQHRRSSKNISHKGCFTYNVITKSER